MSTESLTGTSALLGLILRRNRVWILIWLVSIGLLVFLTTSVGGVIVGCYLEAIARALLKKLFVRTRAALPSQFRTRKPQPATSNNPT